MTGVQTCALPIYDGWDELQQALEVEAAVILPLFLHDHSGLSISTGETCSWDSGQVGFIRMTKKAAEEFGDDTEERLFEILQSDINTYDMYLRGDVHGYIVCNRKGRELDSCWGCYGEEDAIAEAKGVVDVYAEESFDSMLKMLAHNPARSTQAVAS